MQVMWVDQRDNKEEGAGILLLDAVLEPGYGALFTVLHGVIILLNEMN
jgi:hypothetical protein